MSDHRYDLRDLPEELLRPAVPPGRFFGFFLFAVACWVGLAYLLFG